MLHNDFQIEQFKWGALCTDPQKVFQCETAHFWRDSILCWNSSFTLSLHIWEVPAKFQWSESCFWYNINVNNSVQNGSFLSITLHNSVYNLSMNWPFTNVFSIIHSICTAVTSHQFFVKSSLHKFTECQQCVIQCVNLLLAIGNNNIWPCIIQTTEKDLNTSDPSEFFCYEPFVIMFPNLFSSTFTIFSTVFSVAAFRSFFQISMHLGSLQSDILEGYASVATCCWPVP